MGQIPVTCISCGYASLGMCVLYELMMMCWLSFNLAKCSHLFPYLAQMSSLWTESTAVAVKAQEVGSVDYSSSDELDEFDKSTANGGAAGRLEHAANSQLQPDSNEKKDNFKISVSSWENQFNYKSNLGVLSF